MLPNSAQDSLTPKYWNFFLPVGEDEADVVVVVLVVVEVVFVEDVVVFDVVEVVLEVVVEVFEVEVEGAARHWESTAQR